MAQKITKAMVSSETSSAKGQQMFLTRAKNAGEEDTVDQSVRHPTQAEGPNMKLVMNPTGKLHEFESLSSEQQSLLEKLANHSVPAAAKLASATQDTREGGRGGSKLMLMEIL